MSHPMYNPYASGNQRQTQGQYGSANINPDRDPRRGTANMGLPFNSSAASTSANPLSSLPMFSQTMSYRPEPSRAAVDTDMERSIDLQISRAREEARLHGNPMSQSSNQAPSQINTQRDDSYSPFSFPSSSGRQTSRSSDSDSGVSGSLSWLLNLTKSSSAEPRPFLSSSSSYVSSGHSRRDRDETVIPGLGDYPDTEEPPPQRQEPVQAKYSAETAANILRHFNLEKEDLEQLISYPENEITPDNLPLILRQIRIEKTRKAAATSSGYQEPLPTRTVTGSTSSSWPSDCRQERKQNKGTDYGQKDLPTSMSKPGGAMDYAKDRPPLIPKPSSSTRDYSKDIPPIPSKVDLEQKEKSPILQPSQVIDYGHTGKYMAGSGDSMGTIARAIQGIMKIDTGFIREPLPSTTATSSSSAKPVSSSVSSTRDKTSQGAGFTSLFSSTLTSAGPDPSDKPPTQAPKTFSMPKQDTDLRLRKPDAFKEKEKVKEISKTQPSKSPKKTGVILVDSIKRPKNQVVVKKPDLPVHQAKPGQLPNVSHVMSQKGIPRQVLMSMSASQTVTPVLAASPIPTLSSNTTGRPTIIPPAPKQQTIIPKINPKLTGNLLPLTPANKPKPQPQPPPAASKCPTLKGLPTAVMMQDYAAASPRSFPHTCCLCHKECFHMKDWISHQNTVEHLHNCKFLRRTYPEWDGENTLSSSTTLSKDAKTSSSEPQPLLTLSLAQKPRRTRSHSSSPGRHHDSDRRDKHRSRSRSRSWSPHRYSRRSRSHSPPSSSRRNRSSRSRSRERRDSPRRAEERRRNDRWASPKRKDDRRQSPRRTRSSPQRSRERRYSPTRHSPTRYSPTRYSPPRAHDRKVSSPRRMEDKLSQSRSSSERRSSSDKRSSDKTMTQRKKPSAAEQMAKTLLEKSSALKSLTSPSNLDEVVKTLIPALMSEFAKMGSPPVASTTTKKKVMKKPAMVTAKKAVATASKPTAVKPSTMVRLGSIIPPLSHDDVVGFAEKFGKTKSVLLFRQKHQAVVCFEKEEDAKKLRNAKNIQIKEHPVTIVKYKEAVSTTQRKSPVSAVKKPVKPVAKTTTTTTKTTTAKSATTKTTTVKPATAKKVPAATKPAATGASTGVTTTTTTTTTAEVVVTARKPPPPQSMRTVQHSSLKEVVIQDDAKPSSSSSQSQPANKVPPKKVQKVSESEGATEVTSKMAEDDEAEVIEVKKADVEEVEPIEISSSIDCEDEMPPQPESENVVKTDQQPSVLTDTEAIDKDESQVVTEERNQSQEMVKSPEKVDENVEKSDSKILEEKLQEEQTLQQEESTEKGAGFPPKEVDVGLAQAEPPLQQEKTSQQDILTVKDANLMQKDSSPMANVAVEQAEPTLPQEEKVVEQKESSALADVAMEQAEPTLPQNEKVVEQKESSPLANVAVEQAEPTLPQEEKVVEQKQSLPMADVAVEQAKEKVVEQEKPTGDDNSEQDVAMVSVQQQEEGALSPKEGDSVEKEQTVTEDESTLAQVESTVSQTETKMEVSTAEGEKVPAEAPKNEETGIPTLTEAKPDAGPKPDPKPDQTTTTPAPSGPPRGPDPSQAVEPPTVGETLATLLQPSAFSCLTLSNVFGRQFAQYNKKLVLLSNLPEYGPDCAYTETGLAKLLAPFGFQHKDDSIYVIPQCRMAVFAMPNCKCVNEMMKAFVRKPFPRAMFRGFKLKPQVIHAGVFMPPMSFYKSLMRLSKHPSADDGQRTIYISNISPSDAAELREKLRKIGFVKNYLPLLNKVFVEFESSRDADRLGVWHSILNRTPSYEIHRMKTPQSDTTALPPRLAVKAMPDSSDIVAGVTVPGANFGIPPGSVCPFWVTMIAKPYLFPTESPWFIIPDFQTLKTKANATRFYKTSHSTIMLTGLPLENYTHEDIARVVWPYFPNQTLHSLFYKIIVLPLQRRAFVYFPSISKCAEFAKNYFSEPVSVNGLQLHAHYVLKKMSPLLNEEEMYDAFMKLSNTRAPDYHTLEQRLLCASVSEVSPDVIKTVMEVVGSAAPVLSFLPLANRICIEMADASDIPKVMEKFSSFKPESSMEQTIWSKATRLEPLINLNQRLKNSGDTVISLDPSPAEETVKSEALATALSENTAQMEVEATKEEPDTTLTKDEEAASTPQEEKSQTEHTTEEPEEKSQTEGTTEEPEAKLQTESTTEEPEEKSQTEGTTEEPEEKSQTEGTTEEPGTAEVEKEEGMTTVAEVSNENVQENQPQLAEDGEKAVVVEPPKPEASEGEKKESADSTSSSDLPKEKDLEVPRLDQEMFQVLTAAVREHRRHKQQSSDSEQDERKSQTSEDSTTDRLSSRDFPFENLADFVMVDEISEETSDRSPDRHHSSSSSSSRRSSYSRRDRDKSSSSSERYHSSTRSSRESTKRSSSTSSSPRSSKDNFKSPSSSSSSSYSPKKASEPSKSHSSASSSSQTRSPTSYIKNSDVSKSDKYKKDKPKESEVAKSGQKGSDKCSKSQEKDLDVKEKSQKSQTVVELNKEMVQDLRDRNKKRKLEEDSGKSYKILDAVQEQNDGNVTTDDGSQISESFQVLDWVDEGIKTGEDGVELDETFQVVDSVTEEQAKQESTDVLSEEGPSQEISASQSEGEAGVEGNLENLKPETRTKRKREEDDEVLQEVSSKTTKKDDRECTEQETFKILDSTDDLTTTGDAQKGNNASKDAKLVEKDAFQVVDEVQDQPKTRTESKSENVSTRSTRSGRAARSEEKEKSPKRHERTSKKSETRTKREPSAEVSRIEEEIVEEFKVVDSVEEEPSPDEEKTTKRRSTRGRKEEKEHEVLHSVEDNAARHEVSTRSTRERRSRSVKTDSTSDEKSHKEDLRRKGTPARESQERSDSHKASPTKASKDLKECTTDLEQGAFEILDSVEEETATISEKSIRAKSSFKCDSHEKLLQKEDTPSRSRRTLARESQETKGKGEKEEGYQILDSIEEVSTRSSRRARSSPRDYSSDSSHKEGTPTRRRGTPAKDLPQVKLQRSATKVLPKVDVQEAIEEEFEILDAVEDEPPPQPPTKRGRQRKQPQKTATKLDEEVKDSVEKQESKVQESKNQNMMECQDEQKAAEMESSAEKLPKRDEEDEDEPMYEVLDSLEEDQIQDEEMASTEEKIRDDLVEKIDEQAPIDEAVLNEQDKPMSDEGETPKEDVGQNILGIVDDLAKVKDVTITVEEQKNLEMHKDIVESSKEGHKDAFEEPGSGNVEQQTLEQTTMENMEKSENLSDQSSKVAKDQPASEETILETEKKEGRSTKRDTTPMTTRSTRSGRVCRSEEISPKRRASKRYETKQEPKSESKEAPVEKDKQELAVKSKIARSKENVGTLKLDEVSDDEFQVLDSVEEQEQAPQVKPGAKRGRPRKQPKKTASKSDNAKPKCQVIEEVQVAKKEGVSDEQEMAQSERVLEKRLKSEDDEEPLYEVVDSLEEDQVQDEEFGTADEEISETTEKMEELESKDGLPSEEDKLACDVIIEEETAKKEDVTKDLTEMDQTATKKVVKVQLLKLNLETAKVIGKSDLGKVEKDVAGQEKFKVLESLEDKTSSKDMEEGKAVQLEEKHGFEVIDSIDSQATTTKNESETEKSRKRETRVGRSTRSEEKSPNRLEQTSKKYETQTEQESRTDLDDSRAETKDKKDQNQQKLAAVSGDVQATGQVTAENKVKSHKVDMNLDAVSDEEDDFPDDGAEEEGGLVVLDEIIEEEEEEEDEVGQEEEPKAEGKGQKAEGEELKIEESAPEPRPLSQEDQLVPAKSETLETPDEASKQEAASAEETQEPQPSKSVKRKLEEETEEGPNFVTVDEVGEVEDEEEKEEETPKTRGRGRKRSRKTPVPTVRKSTRGRKATQKDEVEQDQMESVEPEVQPSASSVDFGEKGEEAGPSVDVQPETVTNNQPLELGAETDVRVGSKRTSELLGPDPKRSRSLSPSVPSDAKLPPFRPNNPLGQEFVVPKSGFFCTLCSIFYLNESTAREQHCSSRRHYENLKKHFQRQSRGASEF